MMERNELESSCPTSTLLLLAFLPLIHILTLDLLFPHQPDSDSDPETVFGAES